MGVCHEQQLCGSFKNGSRNIGPVMQLCWPPLVQSLDQEWPTQLHHWANISDPILKRAAKLLLMTNSHHFTSFSSNFFHDFF